MAKARKKQKPQGSPATRSQRAEEVRQHRLPQEDPSESVPQEPKDERFELIELWGGDWSGPSAEAVLHEMLPIGDHMSLQLRDQILANDRLREENAKLYRLIPDELREAYREWLAEGEDDESFASYLGSHRAMNLLDQIAGLL